MTCCSMPRKFTQRPRPWPDFLRTFSALGAMPEIPKSQTPERYPGGCDGNPSDLHYCAVETARISFPISDNAMCLDYCLVLCSCPDRTSAERIAGTLVSRHLAACVNILPGITSVYLWKGQIENAAEHLLFIKTTVARYAELERSILEEHPYELPEVIAVPLQNGFKDYLSWICQCLDSNP
ncbi:MAG: divalent-cation tolerance protein CutA [Methylococcales bacterium]